MCPIKQILTRMEAFCMEQYNSCILFKTFQSDFIDFYVCKQKTLKKKSVFLMFDMPRILQNLRERVIGMLNAGMTMNAVAINIGCSARATRHLRQRFQATGPTEDRSRSGSPHSTMRSQSRYIRNTHLRNRFQTATTTYCY